MGNIFGFLRWGIKRKSTADYPDNKRMKYSNSKDTFRPEVFEKKRRASEDGDGQPQAKRRSTDLIEPEKELAVPKGGSTEAEFRAKFLQGRMLGRGGFGCVFAGYRIPDYIPVAIKRIHKGIGSYQQVDYDGKRVPSEVAIMLELDDKTGGSAPVALLDWYDLDHELILVQERPFPAEDLYSYTTGRRGGILKEEEAKIILKQLVDAAIELQDKGVFHRDIKLQNILIETSVFGLRVRLIDFGLSCFDKKGSSYNAFCGTLAHAPPEVYSRRIYKAGPTTVYQMGVVLFEILNRRNFEAKKLIKSCWRVNRTQSKDCHDFLRKCFTVNPDKRPTLEQLKQHPWLI